MPRWPRPSTRCSASRSGGRSPRKAVRQDIEIERVDVYGIDAGRRRAAAAGFDHAADRAIVADDHRLDRAVDAIAHPAAQPQALGHLHHPVAVAHALDAARDGEAGLQRHRGPQANSMIFWSTRRLSPALACSVFTVPSRMARSTFSIFMASTTASTSPALTSCPSLTATEASRPGMGDSRNFDVSGAAFTGISA